MKGKLKVLTFALSGAIFLFACIEGNNIEKANSLFKEGKYDEALTMYESILKKKPEEKVALKAIADIKLIKKDFDGAIGAYKVVLEKDQTQGVKEIVSMLSYNKNVRDKTADAIREMGVGRTEVINEIVNQIAAGNNYVKIDYLDALARIGSPASFSAGIISGYLGDEYFGIRKAALETLSKFNASDLRESGAITKMVKCTRDENPVVAEEAIRSLGALKAGANETVPSLIELLTGPDEIKELAKQAIIDIGPAAKSTLPALIALTDEKNAQVIRIAAIDAMAAMGNNANNSVPVLIPLLQDKNNTVRTASANALTKVGKPSNETVTDLVKLLKHKDANVKIRAIVELSDMGKAASAALVPLGQLSKDADKDVRSEAKSAYDKISKAKR